MVARIILETVNSIKINSCGDYRDYRLYVLKKERMLENKNTTIQYFKKKKQGKKK